MVIGLAILFALFVVISVFVDRRTRKNVGILLVLITVMLLLMLIRANIE